jgi:hypothetical protein
MYTSAIPKKTCLTPSHDIVVKMSLDWLLMSALISLVSFSVI